VAWLHLKFEVFGGKQSCQVKKTPSSSVRYINRDSQRKIRIIQNTSTCLVLCGFHHTYYYNWLWRQQVQVHSVGETILDSNQGVCLGMLMFLMGREENDRRKFRSFIFHFFCCFGVFLDFFFFIFLPLLLVLSDRVQHEWVSQFKLRLKDSGSREYFCVFLNGIGDDMSWVP